MKERLVIAGAHPDDLIGSAGLALLLKDRYEIHLFDFTRGEAGLPGTPYDEVARMRTAEETAACEHAGITPHFLGEIDGDAYANREVTARAADLFRELRPRAVIAHWPVDVHMDHIMSTASTMKAMELAGLRSELYFYEETYQSRSFDPRLYVDITEVFDAKVALIREYRCQNVGDHIVRNKTQDAIFRGSQCGVRYAEAYAVYQPLSPTGKSIFDDLPVLCP